MLSGSSSVFYQDNLGHLSLCRPQVRAEMGSPPAGPEHPDRSFKCVPMWKEGVVASALEIRSENLIEYLLCAGSRSGPRPYSLGGQTGKLIG